MAKLSLSKAWDETKSVIQQNGRQIIPVALAFFVLPFAISDLAFGHEMQPGQPASTAALLIFLAALVVSVVGQLAIQWSSIRPGQTVADAIQRGLRRCVPLLLAGMLIILAISIILAPLLVPVMRNPTDPPPSAAGLLLLLLILLLIPLARLSLAAPVAVVEDVGPIAILKRSWDLTRGSTAKLFGLAILLGLVLGIVAFTVSIVLGSIILLVFGDVGPWTLGALIGGIVTQSVMVFITVPMAIMFARIYTQLAGPAQADVSVPSSGT